MGPWGVERALLRKHWGLEHLLGSVGESEALVGRVWGGWRGVRREQGFAREVREVAEVQEQQGGATFTEMVAR